MSNNIYDILKKFNNLDSVKNMLSEGKKVCKDCGKAKCECVTESKGSKPDYIDLDKDGDTNEPMKKAAKDKSKGAIAEAVARVEQNLAEKYQGFKKSVAEGVKPKGTISPTDSGEEYTAAPGYRVKAEFEPGSTGKPKMGFVKSEPEQTGQGAKPADQTKPVNKKEVDEDMLSPGQKKIARMSPPPNKIDAGDFAALRKDKKSMKKESLAYERNNMPPKDLDRLERWAAGSSQRKSFSLVAKFGIINDMNLQQTLEVLQNFDDEGYASQYGASEESGSALYNSIALFNAYENVYDAWIPPDFDYNEPESVTWAEDYPGMKKEGIEDTLQNILPKSMQPFNTETAAKNAAAARAGRAQAPVKEGFPTVDDAKKRMDAKAGKTAHGTKTVTKTGVKHERNYDADEPTGERGRPKKDKFAK